MRILSNFFDRTCQRYGGSKSTGRVPLRYRRLSIGAGALEIGTGTKGVDLRYLRAKIVKFMYRFI